MPIFVLVLKKPKLPPSHPHVEERLGFLFVSILEHFTDVCYERWFAIGIFIHKRFLNFNHKQGTSLGLSIDSIFLKKGIQNANRFRSYTV